MPAASVLDTREVMLDSRMSSSTGAGRGGLSGCAALLTALLARAALAETSASIASYDVPPECPTQAAWLDALQARLSPLLRTHAMIETLAVHISGNGGDGYSGELSSRGAVTLSSPRHLQGSTCVEVSDALSFVAALELERVAVEQTSADAARPGSALPLGGRAAEDTAIDAGATAPSDDAERLWRYGVSGLLLLQPGLTPGHALGLGGALRVDGSLPGWQPSLLVGVYSTGTAESPLAGGGRVRFQHWSTHTVACPWRFPSTGPFGARPCLEFDAGLSRGDGVDVAGAARHSAPWLSAGTQLRAEIVLWKQLQLGVSLAAVVPFWHANFFFRPDQQSFETATLGFRAGSVASVLF
jgi:hypothetical protein